MTRLLRGDHCRCSTCGEYFNSTYAFDKHRVGDFSARRCRAVAEMRAVGMDQNAGGWWISAASVDSRFVSDSRSGDLHTPAPLHAPQVQPGREAP